MNKPAKNNTQTWPKVRKFLNDIHLWGGLISGIVVLVVCLTGTIYTYNTELREAAIPHYYKVDPAGEKLNIDLLVAQAKPEISGKIVGVKIPFAADRTTHILYAKPKKEEGEKGAHATSQNGKTHSHDEHNHKDGDHSSKQEHSHSHTDKGSPKQDGHASHAEKMGRGGVKAPAGSPVGGRGPRSNQLAVNPYTGQIIGDPADEKTKTAAFMQVMFGLHRWLLLNEVEEPLFEGVENRKLGSWITGSATLLFLLGVISGFVIWFPIKLRGWKNGLKIRWSANWKRVNHDLHNTLGFYSCIILFLMAVTGPFWSFDWYRTGWQKTWGTYKSPDAPKEEKPKLFSVVPPLGNTTTFTIEQTILAVNDLLPYDGDITINFAKDSTETISVTKNRVGFFAPSAADKLSLDQYTGAVVEKDVFKEKPFNERASASIKALHIGDIYGPFTKILYFIACLIATSLPITGVLIWINKMKKK